MIGQPTNHTEIEYLCTEKILMYIHFLIQIIPGYVVIRHENSFRIFWNSGNRFRFFRIGIVGIGISRNRNRSSEF